MTLWHLFALVGVTLIATRGTIFAPLQKRFAGLMHCPMCFGFWVGLGDGICSTESIGWIQAWSIVLSGATVSLASLFVDATLQRLLGEPE